MGHQARTWTYEQVTDGSLAASAFIAVGEEEFFRVKEVIGLMDLPMPEYGSYWSQPNSDRFHLSEEGLVGTVVYRRRNPLMVAAERLGIVKSSESRVFRAAFEAVSDKVLQPLLTIPLTENAVLEINPGIARAPDGELHIRSLRKELKREGLRLLNDDAETVGIVPDADQGTHLRLANNRRAVVVQDAALIPGEAERQASIFGELREEFAAAAQSGRQEAFQKVFAHCTRIAALKPEDPRRILVPYWKDARALTLRQHEVADAAKSFAHQRLVA